MIEIRRATIEDCEKILPLWISQMEFHSKLHFIFKTAPDFKEIAIIDIKNQIKKNDVAFFIASQENELVGYTIAGLSARMPVFEKTKKGYIGDIFVYNKVRNQGVGTKLITASKKWLKENGLDYIDLQVTKANTSGIKFREKHGFKTVNYYMVNNINE